MQNSYNLENEPHIESILGHTVKETTMHIENDWQHFEIKIFSILGTEGEGMLFFATENKCLMGGGGLETLQNKYSVLKHLQSEMKHIRKNMLIKWKCAYMECF